MLHCHGNILGVLRSSLGCARDFACVLGRTQRGSTSTFRSLQGAGVAYCSKAHDRTAAAIHKKKPFCHWGEAEGAFGKDLY